ncbi:MAG: RNA 3'-terminal phosphate cyclase [Planctomycetia bacterium]|nr:RNA 3'-terminal phosphate cyclase [Planctomycetia bacterium]
MIEIDGSLGEGGGQILRSSLALSLVTGKPFHLRHIRARRPKPGLHPQHLMSVRAAATVGQAKVRGDALHSQELFFEPGPVTPGKFTFNIGTAGATGLVLHTIYLPLAYCCTEPSELVLQGGTHVTTSPCYHFLAVSWRKYVEKLGLNLGMKLLRPGFYPRGGGTVEVHIQPCRKLRGLKLPGRGQLTKITGISAVAGLPEDIARRQARRLEFRLRDAGLPVAIKHESWEGGPGTVVTAELDTAPAPTLFFGLGAKGKPAESVADEAADQVLHYLAAPGAVDAHSADQLVLPLALAEGPSQFSVAEVTQHLLTNIAVIRQFVDRDITCEGDEGQPGTVHVR